MSPADSLLSKAAVMERLGVSDKTLRRLIRQGRLRVVKLGKTSPLKFRQLDLAPLAGTLRCNGRGSFLSNEGLTPLLRHQEALNAATPRENHQGFTSRASWLPGQ